MQARSKEPECKDAHNLQTVGTEPLQDPFDNIHRLPLCATVFLDMQQAVRNPTGWGQRIAAVLTKLGLLSQRSMPST